MFRHFLLCTILTLLWLMCAKAWAGTLETVKKNGVLRCGVSTGLPGFSMTDEKGIMNGFDADICRAIAAAVLNDANKVSFVKLSAKDRFAVLQNGEIDVLSRNTTRTFSNEVGLQLIFPAYTFFDGQGFMTRQNIQSVEQLKGATICTQTGTTAERNVADFFRQRGWPYHLVVYEKSDEALNAYQMQRCDAFTNDTSGLYALRLKLYQPADHHILTETISQEPFALAVRQDDAQWARVVAWSFLAMVHAEELGITSENAAQIAQTSTSLAVQKLLGRSERMGQMLGLSDAWAYNIVSQVGNYQQIYDKNLGTESLLNIPRARNVLATQGGLMLAPPLR